MSGERYFYSYRSAMTELDISRRTLQRWLEDLEIKPHEFPDHLKVFLGLPHMQILRDYAKIMKTRNNSLIARFRKAVITENNRILAKIKKEVLDA